MYADLGRPGDTFAGCGRPSNLVMSLSGDLSDKNNRLLNTCVYQNKQGN